MSNSASFWAAKSNGVKSPTRPAEIVAKPVALCGPPKKAGMVVKGRPTSSERSAHVNEQTGTTNGVKKVDWADSDEDEDFLASFTASGLVQKLEKTVTVKDSHITDLTAALQDKEAHITDIQKNLEEQQHCLSELQSNADAFITQIEDLKKENHKQFLHVQKLVAEVDEKDRRIAALETKFDERGAQIAQLDVSDSSIQVSSQDVPTASVTSAPSGKPGATGATPLGDKACVEAAPAFNETPASNETAKEVNSKSTAVSTTPSALSTPAKSAGPAVSLSGFPIFATPTTLKQVAPPPPAPKLKMPVDLSKFAKKPASARVTRQKKVDATADEAAKAGPAPNIDPSTDIRTKRHEERKLFGNGPKVQVKMGDASLATVPKYVLMQCSSKAWKHFTDNPDAISFTLPAGSMDATAATAHLEWMKEMTYQGRVYSITLHSDKKFDDKNLNICRAARVLGLNNMYVGHFTKIFCDRIRSNDASYDFLDKVAVLAYPENDPIIDCLANKLANLGSRNAAKKPTELEAFLQKHTSLKARVRKMEERMRKKQDIAKGVEGSKDARATMGEKVVHVSENI